MYTPFFCIMLFKNVIKKYELYKLIIMGGFVLCNIHFFRYECKLVWKKIPENATLISVKNGRMRKYEQRSSKTGFC